MCYVCDSQQQGDTSVCEIMRSTGTINSLKQPPTQRLGGVCKGSFVPVSSQHQQRGHCTLQQTQKSSTHKHGRWRVTAGEGTSQVVDGLKGRGGRQEESRDERLESDCWRLSGVLCSEGTGLNQKHYKSRLVDCTCFLESYESLVKEEEREWGPAASFHREGDTKTSSTYEAKCR